MNISFSKKEAQKVDFSTWGWVEGNGKFAELAAAEAAAAIADQLQSTDEALDVELLGPMIHITLPFGASQYEGPHCSINLLDMIKDRIKNLEWCDADEIASEHKKLHAVLVTATRLLERAISKTPK